MTAGAGGLLAILGLGLAWRRRPNRLRLAALAVAVAGPGEALFVAKGCTQCHQNGNVTIDHTHLSSFGPDLTEYQSSVKFLRLWLSDPASVKPETTMPDLGLSEREIVMLIDFLRADVK